MKTVSLAFAVSVALAGGVRADDGFDFKPDTLVVSRSVYSASPSLLVPGVTVLPPGCMAETVNVPLIAGGTVPIAVTCTTTAFDATFPDVFNNAAVDGHFGITSPIFLDNLTTDGHRLGTLAIPTDQIVTSFSSKSELAVHRSVDGKSVTFMGYRGSPGFPTAANRTACLNARYLGSAKCSLLVRALAIGSTISRTELRLPIIEAETFVAIAMAELVTAA